MLQEQIMCALQDDFHICCFGTQAMEKTNGEVGGGGGGGSQVKMVFIRKFEEKTLKRVRNLFMGVSSSFSPLRGNGSAKMTLFPASFF